MARTKPHNLLVAILGVVAGFLIASVVNRQLMGMSFVEIVAVVAVVTAVVMGVYTLLRRRSALH